MASPLALEEAKEVGAPIRSDFDQINIRQRGFHQSNERSKAIPPQPTTTRTSDKKNQYSSLEEPRDDDQVTTATSKAAKDKTATSNAEAPPKSTTMHQTTGALAIGSFELNNTDFPPMVGNSFNQHSKVARDVIEPQV